MKYSLISCDRPASSSEALTAEDLTAAVFSSMKRQGAGAPSSPGFLTMLFRFKVMYKFLKLCPGE
jgi:hypothetical protein